MSTVKPLYGSSASLTITLNSLATDSNLLAGRQSTEIDNATDLALDALVGGVIATSSTPTANTVIEVWVFASWDGGTTRTASAGASDAALSPATIGVKNLMALAAVINQTDTTARSYSFGPFSVAALFGAMPETWGVYVVHNTGQNLNSSGNSISYTPVQNQIV